MIEALSFTAIEPPIEPLAPNAGENVTSIVQAVPAGRIIPAEHGADPPPAAAKKPLPENPESVTLLVLVFFMAILLGALIVPPAWLVKVRVVGMKESGGVPPPEPVPENATICGLNDVLSVMDKSPLIAPAAVGVNVTATLHFPLDASDPVQVVPGELMA